MDSEILCLQLQRDAVSSQDIPTLWYIAGNRITEPKEGGRIMVDVPFYVVGTGWDFDPEGKHYVGTIQTNGLVWHYWMESQQGVSLHER